MRARTRAQTRHGERGNKARWMTEGNIPEWTGLGLGKSPRAIENRDKWKEERKKTPIAKSSQVPQRTS